MYSGVNRQKQGERFYVFQSPVFLYDLTGNILGIVDSAGAFVTEYVYDAWGKLLSVTDANDTAITNPADIAHVNPIRYRGYYYDTEEKA